MPRRQVTHRRSREVTEDWGEEVSQKIAKSAEGSWALVFVVVFVVVFVIIVVVPVVVAVVVDSSQEIAEMHLNRRSQRAQRGRGRGGEQLVFVSVFVPVYARFLRGPDEDRDKDRDKDFTG